MLYEKCSKVLYLKYVCFFFSDEYIIMYLYVVFFEVCNIVYEIIKGCKCIYFVNNVLIM